jgi:hypothetical protein
MTEKLINFGGEKYLLTIRPTGEVEAVERLGEKPAVIDENSRLHLAIVSAYFNQLSL